MVNDINLVMPESSEEDEGLVQLKTVKRRHQKGLTNDRFNGQISEINEKAKVPNNDQIIITENFKKVQLSQKSEQQAHNSPDDNTPKSGRTRTSSFRRCSNDGEVETKPLPIRFPNSGFTSPLEGSINLDTPQCDHCQNNTNSTAFYQQPYQPSPYPSIYPETNANLHAYLENDSKNSFNSSYIDTSNVSKQLPYPNMATKTSTIVVLVGLPARGKTFISGRLTRYLNWVGLETKIFNVGEYRRRMCKENMENNNAAESGGNGMKQDASFFDPANERGQEMRSRFVVAALRDLVSWIDEDPGRIAVLDATNTTRERRNRIQMW